MKKLICILSVGLLSNLMGDCQAKQLYKTKSVKNTETSIKDFILEAGTKIELFLLKSISSKDLEKGDFIGFYVKNNLNTKEGKNVIAHNTYVEATVIKVQKARSGGKAGEIDLMIHSITASDGQSIPVFFNFENQGQDNSKEVSIASLFTLWAVFSKGGEAEIKAGSTIIVETTRSVKFNTSKLTRSIDQENSIYKKIMSEYTNPCGEKPKEPLNTFNKYKFHLSKEYKVYQRKLVEWEKCMQE
jgi:hypothetical protein